MHIVQQGTSFALRNSRNGLPATSLGILFQWLMAPVFGHLHLPSFSSF